MEKDLTQQLADLTKRVDELSDYSRIPFDTERALKERLGKYFVTEGLSTATAIPTATLEREVTLSLSGNAEVKTFKVLDYPDSWLQITIKGTVYKIPIYND